MTLGEVLRHVFSDEDLDKELEQYTVRNTLNLQEYEIILENKEIIAKIVKNKENKKC